MQHALLLLTNMLATRSQFFILLNSPHNFRQRISLLLRIPFHLCNFLSLILLLEQHKYG